MRLPKVINILSSKRRGLKLAIPRLGDAPAAVLALHSSCGGTLLNKFAHKIIIPWYPAQTASNANDKFNTLGKDKPKEKGQ